MRKLLIVCPHYNDNHVSSFRITQIENVFKEKNIDVKILTLSNKNEIKDNVYYIRKDEFKNNARIRFLPKSTKVFVKDIFSKFDYIIFSMPSFQFIDLIKYVPLDVKIILDYRDQIDLDFFIRKHKFNSKVIKFLSYLDMKYSYYHHKKIINNNENIFKILCVGDVATKLYKKQLANNNVDIINIHNGFQKKDSIFLKKKIEIRDNNKNIKIGLSGSVYEFRCGEDLEKLIAKINHIAVDKSINIEILHWGNACDKFINIIKDSKNLTYLPQGRKDRCDYLNEISSVDYLLLLCSDDILWEPTTTVFDYILMKKPIIYNGSLLNEACNILNNSKVIFLTVNDEIKFTKEEMILNQNIKYENIEKYNREYNVEKLHAEIFIKS